MKTEDKDLDGQLDFEELVHYLRAHEKKLRLVFKSVDEKDNGKTFILGRGSWVLVDVHISSCYCV